MKLMRHIVLSLGLVLVIGIMVSIGIVLVTQEAKNRTVVSPSVSEIASDIVPSGWYDARYTNGMAYAPPDSTVEELLSYQELYGKNPSETTYPPFLLEFYSKTSKICDVFTWVETDKWPSTISAVAGMTYICYSYSAFENAIEMPYPDIEKSIVVIDTSIAKDFETVPGIIYTCV